MTVSPDDRLNFDLAATGHSLICVIVHYLYGNLLRETERDLIALCVYVSVSTTRLCRHNMPFGLFYSRQYNNYAAKITLTS